MIPRFPFATPPTASEVAKLSVCVCVMFVDD